MKQKQTLQSLKDEGLVKPASEIPVPEAKNTTKGLAHYVATHGTSVLFDGEAVENGIRLRAFCKQFRTNPDDLFAWLMENYGQPKKLPKNSPKTPNKAIVDKSTFAADLRSRKCGLE